MGRVRQRAGRVPAARISRDSAASDPAFQLFRAAWRGEQTKRDRRRSDILLQPAGATFWPCCRATAVRGASGATMDMQAPPVWRSEAFAEDLSGEPFDSGDLRAYPWDRYAVWLCTVPVAVAAIGGLAALLQTMA
jgi:hypothetical protein